MALLGRDGERAAIAALIQSAHASRGEVLVVRGAPGVGKSALLEDAVAGARDMRVLRASGIEGEAELAFGGLHQLVWPLRGMLGQLPAVQANVMRAVLGTAQSAATDRFTVGAATLGLLAAAAGERPLLCLIDDAQWLDAPSGEAITFAARRLAADPIGLVLAMRNDAAPAFDIAGFREMPLGGIEAEAAQALLLERADGPLDANVRARILQLAQGVPLALLELPLALTNAQLAGREPVSESLPLTPVLEDAFLARARVLPMASQRLLLAAAADTTGDPAVVVGAAERLGIRPCDFDRTDAAGLLHVSQDGVVFRHPLVRSAVYQSAPSAERSLVHRVLAQTPDPDRRAWHQAAAAPGPDDSVADALEQSAQRARARAGFSATAAALRRASLLTTEPGKRARRLAAAAEAAWLAGQPASAAALLQDARKFPADVRVRSDLDYIQALTEIADAAPADAYIRLSRAADAIAAADPGRTQTLLLQAREAAMLSADTGAEAHVSRRAEELMNGPADDPFPAQFLGGMARWLDGDIPGAVPRLQQAMRQAAQAADPRRMFWAGIAATRLGQDVQTRHFFRQYADQARSEGSVAMVAQALIMVAIDELGQGRAASAKASAAEGLSLALATRQQNIAAFHLAVLARVAASFGTEEETRSLVADCHQTVLPGKMPLIDLMTSVALGEMELARGRTDRALAHLGEVATYGLAPADPLIRLNAFPAFAEASARAGQRGTAAKAAVNYGNWFTAAGSTPNLALLARIRAILATDDSGEYHFADALRLHATSGRPFDRARTQLLYGEALRRRRHRLQARTQLRAALEALERLGAEPWAERARSELRASGQTARRRDLQHAGQLTPQERQVARIIAGGATTKQAATQLFLSPRTVDAHLRSIYAKLGISSRGELAAADFDDVSRDPPRAADPGDGGGRGAEGGV